MRIGDVLYHGDHRYILSSVQQQTAHDGDRLVLIYVLEEPVVEPVPLWRRVMRGIVGLN